MQLSLIILNFSFQKKKIVHILPNKSAIPSCTQILVMTHLPFVSKLESSGYLIYVKPLNICFSVFYLIYLALYFQCSSALYYVWVLFSLLQLSKRNCVPHILFIRSYVRVAVGLFSLWLLFEYYCYKHKCTHIYLFKYQSLVLFCRYPWLELLV